MNTRLNSRNMTVTGKYNLCKAALIGAIIGILSFSPIWINNNGQYMDYGDYFLQYIPFIKELKRMVLSGDFLWSWNSFLGAGFVESYSYYTVFNIFGLNHKFCGISDSSRSSVGSYRIASERNIRHQYIRIPVCEES